TLTNNGPNNAAAVSLTDMVPTGTTFVSATAVSGMNPDGFTYTQSAGLVTGTPTGGIVMAGNLDKFTLVVTVTATTGTITNTATAHSSTADPNAANNSSTVTTTVSTSADLAVTKTGPGIAMSGTTIAYMIVITNNGPSDAKTVTLSDLLPSTETFV